MTFLSIVDLAGANEPAETLPPLDGPRTRLSLLPHHQPIPPTQHHDMDQTPGGTNPRNYHGRPRGILVVYDGFSRGRVEHSLPPEHRIVAERPGTGSTEYLIEGPNLPIAPAGREPLIVSLIFTMTRENCGRVTLSAVWQHEPQTSWVIDAWPDWDAYKAELEALG